MLIARRSFLAGLGALIAAPAVVRADVLMPLRGVVVPLKSWDWISQYDISRDTWIARAVKKEIADRFNRNLISGGGFSETTKRILDLHVPRDFDFVHKSFWFEMPNNGKYDISAMQGPPLGEAVL
jgi:hypothetical protein